LAGAVSGCVVAGPVLVVAAEVDGVVHDPERLAQGDVDLAVGVGVVLIVQVGSVGVIVVGILLRARLLAVVTLGGHDLRGKGRPEPEFLEGEVGLRQLLALGLDGLAERVVVGLLLAPLLQVERDELLRLALLEPFDVLSGVGELLEAGLALRSRVGAAGEDLGVEGRPSKELVFILSQTSAWGRSDSPIGRYSSTEGRTMSETTPFSWVEEPSGR
jgi:hypothetical protein